MQVLLIVAIVVIALAVVTQTLVLMAMFLMSRNLGTKVDGLMADTRRLLPPLETITTNLRTASGDLAEAGKIARRQVEHVQELVTETHDSIRRPLREYSAIAHAVAAGVRTFFSRPEQTAGRTTAQSGKKRQDPAA
jgi:hypothetical protein